MVCPLGPAVILTARPPERLFHLVFESPWWKGLGAESEEKREPVSDIDTGVVVSLKVLDPDGRLEKRTNNGRLVMSALCQSRTNAPQQKPRLGLNPRQELLAQAPRGLLIDLRLSTVRLHRTVFEHGHNL